MKVLHLSTSDIRGGAARGAYFLHRKLCERGIESRMLVGRKHSNDETVTQLSGPFAPVNERIRAKLDGLPLRRYDKTDESFWTVGWQPRNIRRAVSAFAPDLVHIQWTGGGFLPVESLRSIDVPIVWTMRDMWGFTGGCHYTAGCTRYIDGCGICPQLRSDGEGDLSRQTVQRKRKAWDGLNFWLVPISEWMADRTRESQLLQGSHVHVIPNGIDSNRFRPIDRREARRAFGLPEEGRFVLFVALNALSDKRKGFWHLAKALDVLESAKEPDPPELLVAGDLTPDNAPDLGLKTRFLGTITDTDRLATLYSAADVMVAPSLQEAFGKTHVEAMSCGTPVVAFDSGGPSEIILHDETGYLAEPFEPEALAQGIDRCLSAVRHTPGIGKAARDRVLNRYDIDVVAGHYIDHYRHILETAA